MDRRDKLINEAMLNTFVDKPIFAAQLEALRKSKRQMQEFVDEMAEITAEPLLRCHYTNSLIELEDTFFKNMLRL